MYLHPFYLHIINNNIEDPQFLMNILDNMGFSVTVIIKGNNFYFKVDEKHYLNEYINNDEASFMSRIYYILRELLMKLNPNYNIYGNIYYLYNILFEKLKNISSINSLKEDCLKLFFQENPITVTKDKLFQMKEEILKLREELNNMRNLCNITFNMPKLPILIPKKTCEIGVQTEFNDKKEINIQTDNMTNNNYCQTTFSMSPRTNCDLNYIIKNSKRDDLKKEINDLKKKISEFQKLNEEKDVIYTENIKNKNDIITTLEKRTFIDLLKNKQITAMTIFNFISTLKTDICTDAYTCWKMKFIFKIAQKDFRDKSIPNFAEFWTIILYRINTHTQGTLGKINIEWNAFNLTCASCGVPITVEILNLLFWFMCDNYMKKDLGILEFLPNFFQALLFYCASIPKMYKLVTEYGTETELTTEKKFDYTTRFLRLFLIKKPYDLCELMFKDMQDKTSQNFRFLEELF